MCRETLDEVAHPWSVDAEQDFDSAQPVTLTQAIEPPEESAAELQIGDTPNHAGLGHLLYTAGLDPLPLLAELAEEVEDAETLGFS